MVTKLCTVFWATLYFTSCYLSVYITDPLYKALYTVTTDFQMRYPWTCERSAVK